MVIKLNKDIISFAIEHLEEYGDTDIFPHSLELKFFREYSDQVSSNINTMLKSGNYKPMSAIECITPKSNKGFRICHLLSPKDTLLITASVLSIAKEIENYRVDKNEKVAFSYRYEPNEKGLFSEDCKYKSWLQHQVDTIENDENITHIVKTDISDFYQRIYQHRLENEIDSAINKTQKHIKNIIVDFIKEVRGKQSFGIPVGTNAMRILAELLMNSTDEQLLDEGYQFTRYVDDFRIFIDDSQDYFSCLSFLSEYLLLVEGLSLGEHKTHILSRKQYLEELKEILGLDSENKEDEGDIDEVEFLYQRLYEDEDFSEEDLESLQNIDLIELLENEINLEKPDGGKVRVLFRSMRITKPLEAVDFIFENFESLLPFSKEVVLLIDELSKDYPEETAKFTDKIIHLIQNTQALENLPLIICWLLELFVRGSIPVTKKQLNSLNLDDNTIIRRQVILIKSLLGDKSYFRTKKTKFDEFNEMEKVCFIYGAKCLPIDELTVWLSHIKKKDNIFMAKEYCEWVLSQKNEEENSSNLEF